MKRCPECRRDYYDDSLLYCLDDGTALLEGPASGNEPATAILHETSPPSEDATRPHIHMTEPTPRRPVPQHSWTGIRWPKMFGIAFIFIVGGYFAYRSFI